MDTIADCPRPLGGYYFCLAFVFLDHPGIIVSKYTDLKTEASFFFLPQKFCGNYAKLLWKSFVISMGFQSLFLRFEIKEEIYTGMINSKNSGIFFGALEFVQTIISQFVYLLL